MTKNFLYLILFKKTISNNQTLPAALVRFIWPCTMFAAFLCLWGPSTSWQLPKLHSTAECWPISEDVHAYNWTRYLLAHIHMIIDLYYSPLSCSMALISVDAMYPFQCKNISTFSGASSSWSLQVVQTNHGRNEFSCYEAPPAQISRGNNVKWRKIQMRKKLETTASLKRDNDLNGVIRTKCMYSTDSLILRRIP